MSYQVPSTGNNIDVVKYDLKNLAIDILLITGNRKLYNEFIRKINTSIYSRDLLSSLLFSQTKPIGYLENIRVLTNDYNQFVKIACLGFDYSNEMNDIRNEIKPAPSITAGRLECDFMIPIWEATTAERIERNNNRINIINSFRIIGITGMLYTATTRKYTTVDDVKAVRDQLLDIYESIIENDTTKIIIPAIKNTLDRLKNITLQVLSNKEQNAYNIITIKLERKYSAQLISYELYGEYIKTEKQLNEFANIIKGLNNNQPAHAMQGEIRIIQI